MCTNPIYAKVIEKMVPDGISGNVVYEKRLKFLNRDEIIELKDKDMSLVDLNKYITLPCRKCIECNIMRSKEWSLRCSYELKLHDKNCFITLTYAETDGSLNHRDIQLFIKRLRKSLNTRIRYFGCGEYGSKGKRPHYHMIIFGYDFPDKKFYTKSKKGELLFRSKLLEKLWPLGYSSIGVANEQSIKYCSLYLTKSNLIYDKIPQYHVDSLTGEVTGDIEYYLMQSSVKDPYLFMSTKPGIGINYFVANYKGATELWLNGKKVSIPDYFLKRVTDECFMKVKNKRHVISDFQLKESFEDLELRKKKNKKQLQLFGK